MSRDPSTEEPCGTCTNQTCSAQASAPGESAEEAHQRRQLASRLCRIRNKVLVMSGKGGVGKSTVAVNLAATLAAAGRSVGLLDADLHGPSVPRMLGLDGKRPEPDGAGIAPLRAGALRVMSVGFFLPDPEAAVVWRGPLKAGFLRQLLADVSWGDLDDLVVDCPPGTGDEPLSVAQLLQPASGAVIVTTPQELALIDVRRSVSFCRQLGVPVLGVVENMSSFACPHCGSVSNPFSSGGGEQLARENGIPFLGRVPLDPEVMAAAEEGRPYLLGRPQPDVAQLYAGIVDRLTARLREAG